MVWVVVALCVIATALAAIVAAYYFELLRIASFIKYLPEDSNLRLDEKIPLPGANMLIKAVNGHIDKTADQMTEIHQEEAELLEGLANLSHDIRTPLAGAKGYGQLAAEEKDPREAARFLSLAQSRLDAMQVILDQLFSYMRTLGFQGDHEREKVDVISILSSVMAGHYPEFREAEAEPVIHYEQEKLVVLGDPEALRRIFDNLVSNMIVHGAGGISVEQKGSQIRFCNNLKAGDEPNESLVFKRFYRSDSARSSVGAGLGLAVVKELCSIMEVGLTVAVRNETFEVVLVFSDNEVEY